MFHFYLQASDFVLKASVGLLACNRKITLLIEKSLNTFIFIFLLKKETMNKLRSW